MKAEIYTHDGEGVKWVYNNRNWVLCIKNWKPDNDIEGIHHLEIHHETDEQFILVNGKAILLVADRKEDKFEIELIEMEIGKAYNVPKETWFYSITQKDTKMMYVQDAGTSDKNSEYCEMTEQELAEVRNRAAKIFSK